MDEEDGKEVFFSTLSIFQHQGTMVDVIVEVENEQFPSHRLVLSVYSLFFRAMFSSQMREEREERIRLSVLSAEQFRLVHDYMYGRLRERIRTLELQTALLLAEAANYLDMRSLLCVCGQTVVKKISPESILQIEPDLYEACCRYNLSDAVRHIDRLYLVQFYAPGTQEALMKLSVSRLTAYGSSDDLRLKSEMDLVDVIKRWYESRDDNAEEADVFYGLLYSVRIGLLYNEENIDDFITICETMKAPIARVSPWPDSLQLRKALVNQPFWRLFTDDDSSEVVCRCKPRALMEVCCHVTLQDLTFTLRFCHIFGPNGIDYNQVDHQNGIHPRFTMSSRRFTSMKLHRTTSLQWHCCSRYGYFFIYVEQAMEPASQAPGVMCVFDSAREVFHCFDGVAPLLSMMSMASCGDALYIMGGRTSEGTYSFRSVDSIFAFNFRKIGWIRLQKPILPQPAHSQAAATMDDNVYLCGGICCGYSEEDAHVHNIIVGRPLNFLWRLPSDASSVTVLAPMLQSRYQHRLLACRRFLYSVGGVCESLVSGSQQGGIERYDPTENQWTALDGITLDATVPPSVRFFGPVLALESDGCIYVMGRGVNPPAVGLWQFNPEDTKWQVTQIISWEKQQMLTAFIPWSCLNSRADQSDSSISSSKLHWKNHDCPPDARRMLTGFTTSSSDGTSVYGPEDRTRRVTTQDDGVHAPP